MNEKELVRHLSSLSGLNPETEWVKKNREILSYQIFNGQEFAEAKVSRFSQFVLVMHRVLQPAPIAALIALFFVVSGIVGLKSSGNATPNNRVLYIAKILNEKANLATTFDEKGKLALNVDYAHNRVTEIDQITQNTNATSDPRVKELTDSFQAEIDSARQRLIHLNEIESKQNANTATVAKVNPIQVIKKNNEVHKASVKNSDDAVMSADSIKKEKPGTAVPTDTEKADISGTAKADTSVDDKTEVTTPADTEKVLEEAEKLFYDKNYKEAADKLREIKIQ